MTTTIVTIDGPAGSGKSSVAAQVAQALGFIHFNSGLLYRAVSQQASLHGVSYEDELGLRKLAQALDFSLSKGDFPSALSVFNRESKENLDVASLSDEKWGIGASRVGVFAEVRNVLTEVQREIGKSHSLVLEGRDAGSVVFPNARCKFYLDASVEERARRRAAQVAASSGEKVSAVYDQVLEDIRSRDLRDESRDVAPQVVPDDAEKISTEGRSIEDIVNQICSIVRSS